MYVTLLVTKVFMADNWMAQVNSRSEQETQSLALGPG